MVLKLDLILPLELATCKWGWQVMAGIRWQPNENGKTATPASSRQPVSGDLPIHKEANGKDRKSWDAEIAEQCFEECQQISVQSWVFVWSPIELQDQHLIHLCQVHPPSQTGLISIRLPWSNMYVTKENDHSYGSPQRLGKLVRNFWCYFEKLNPREWKQRCLPETTTWGKKQNKRCK